VSRVNRLAAETPSVFVAFDLLALGEESWLERPFAERRARLIDVVKTGPSAFITPASGDAAVANEWFTTFEGAGLDGIVAKRVDEPYQPDKRALVKVKHQRTADCALAGYRIHKDGQGVGSMLLGLFDDDGVMHHVGVAAAFTASQRRELLTELAPLTENAIEGHPWAEWAEFATMNQPTSESETQRRPGATSRWNAGKDLSWVPLRVERVVEVTFGQLENGRFRHGVTFVRWRPDREPESCRYDQLDVAAPVDFHQFMATSAG
jgi:ATP-dependent DNA ligase